MTTGLASASNRAEIRGVDRRHARRFRRRAAGEFACNAASAGNAEVRVFIGVIALAREAQARPETV